MQRLEAAASIRDAIRQFARAELTGCHFAQAIMQSGEGVSWITIVDPPQGIVCAELDDVLDAAAAADELVVFIFPNLRTPIEVVDLVKALGAGPRWRVRRRSWKVHARSDVLLGISWRTPAGKATSVLGLAPIGSMPVTRRAPFVSLVIWPGEPRNNFRQPHPGIGIGDMPPPRSLDRPGYDRLREKTEAKVKELISVPPEGAARRDVTFCVPQENAESLG